MGYSESAVRIRVRIRFRVRLGLGLGLDSVRGSTISHKMKYLPRRMSYHADHAACACSFISTLPLLCVSDIKDHCEFGLEKGKSLSTD